MHSDKDAESLRFDVQTLQALTDANLDRGARDDDPLLRACAAVLRDREDRLTRLEKASRTFSRGAA